MAQYTITNKDVLNWNAQGHERILQNISNILSTYKYEVAYDRVFGRDNKNIDKASNKSLGSIIAETYDLIQKYEPRATIQEINVENQNGNILIKVVVEIE